jgi:hypothetical protein
MAFYRTFCCIAVALLPMAGLAQPPYPLNGLHTELTFTEAIDRAQQIGGSCKDTRPNRKRGGVSAACDYTLCNSPVPGEICNQEDDRASSFTLAKQRVTLVEFEAPGPDSQVSMIGIFFEGEHAAVMEELIAAFGKPNNDTLGDRKDSWTNSRRLFWHQGNQRVGLMDSPKMILMAADRKPTAPP